MKQKLPDWSREIKELRSGLRLTQGALADLLGISKKVVADWEQGKQQPSARRYIQLAKLARREQALWFLDHLGLDQHFLAGLLTGRAG